MAQEQDTQKFEELPTIQESVKSAVGNYRPSSADQMLTYQNGIAKAITNGLDESIEDSKVAANTLLKVMQGDAEALQHVKQYADNAANALLDPETWRKVGQHLQNSAAEIQTAYTKGDYEKMGSLTGAAVMATVGPGEIKVLKELGEIKSVAGAATDAEKAVAASTKALEAVNSDHFDNLPHWDGRRRGPIEIDGNIYESGQVPRQAPVREPLELVPKEESITGAYVPRTTKISTEPPKSIKQDDEHLVLKATIAGGVVIAATAGGLEYVKEHKAQERRHNVELADAYNNAISGPRQDRQARYEETLKLHPELIEAFALYELIRQAANKDGKINQHEQQILQQVASNTTIKILDGKIDDIKITPESKQLAAEVNHQQAPQR